MLSKLLINRSTSMSLVSTLVEALLQLVLTSPALLSISSVSLLSSFLSFLS